MRRGFTLVEVVVVLVVLGIAAAAVAPAFLARTPQDDAAAAAAEVIQVLATARRAAVERGEPVTVTLETRSGAYLVRSGPAAADSVATGRVVIPAGVALVNVPGRAVSEFDPLGGARPATLRIVGTGTVMMIEVDRWTGDTRVVSR
ncbi:MAG TPA: GspH/FimT family pseudopilin [Longimicrobium sp.]|jgi:type II secretion system protein H